MVSVASIAWLLLPQPQTPSNYFTGLLVYMRICTPTDGIAVTPDPVVFLCISLPASSDNLKIP